MPYSIAAGGKLTTFLPAGDQLTVTGTAEVNVQFAKTRRSQKMTGTLLFGPYRQDVDVEIIATSSVTWDVATYVIPAAALTEAQVPALQALVSGAGNLTSSAVRLVTFGDSINQNAIYTTGTDPDGVSPAPWFQDGATDNSWRGWGWLAWVGPISMQRAQIERNYAVQSNGLLAAGTSPAGQPVSAQVTRYLCDRAVGIVKPHRAVILVGSNDTASTVAACVAELLAQIARLDVPVDLVASPPRGGTPTGVVGDGLQIWAWLQQWRAACSRIADASGGRVRFIDAYGLGNSPTTVPDVMQAGYTYDNTHPNSAYAFRIADAYVASLIPALSGDLDLWPNNSNASSSGGNNLIDQGVINPLLGTASGGTTGTGASGTVAGSYTVARVATGSVVCSVISNPNGLGNMQRMVITSGAAGDGASLSTATFHAAGGTFLSAGDRVYLQCLVTINSGGIYPRNLRVQFLAFDGTTNYLSKCFDIDATKEVALPLSASRTLLIRTPEFVVPAGITWTSVVGSLVATFAAAGSCTVDVGNVECRRTRAGGVYA